MYRLYRVFEGDKTEYGRHSSQSKAYLIKKAKELHLAYCKLPKQFQIPNCTKVTYIIKSDGNPVDSFTLDVK
ncbi:MAG: hypothetical protein J6U92_05220 [Clostridia bacterium]|nr:hypothetical protein [Clostridia bacterium]